jgi:hypothetical protein
MDAVKHDLEQKHKDLGDRIESKSKELNSQIEEVKASFGSLESKLDEVSTGGIKIQLFGVMLMVYGAIAGFFA